MDKPTTYVKITGNLIYKGLIYPVREHITDSLIWVIEGTNFEFLKSDCEPYEMQPETSLDQEIAEFREKVESSPNFTGRTNHYLEGYLKAKSESATAFDNGFKQAQRNLQAVPEGQHIIKTEQLQHIVTTLRDADIHYLANTIVEWFPAVFVPAKTYKVGDRFTWPNKNNHVYRIIYMHDYVIALLIEDSDCIAWGATHKVSNHKKITHEEMESLTSYRFGAFTLLPDSTDQMV
jgi:hypothetical protein